MTLPGQADFAYGNTRLRARRSTLLRDADYERLLGTAVPGLLGALEDTPYGPDADAAGGTDSLRRLHVTISRHLSRSLTEMRSFYAGRAHALLGMLLARFDADNIIAVLRAKSGGQRAAEDALVHVGWMAGPHSDEILRQNELAGAVELLARSTPDREQGAALRTAFSEYERTEDLAAFERAVVADHAARLSARLAAAGAEAATLLHFAQREVDERNLLVALRLRDAVASGAEAETPPAATRIPGGSIPPEVFGSALKVPAPAAVATRLGRLAGRTWQRPLERWAASGDVSALERELERRRFEDATSLFVAGDPLAIDVPIAFTAAKQAEARNLRLLGEASVRGIDPEVVRRELLWSKGHS